MIKSRKIDFLAEQRTETVTVDNLGKVLKIRRNTVLHALLQDNVVLSPLIQTGRVLFIRF